jgi:CHAD domain-containing protein
MKERAARRPRPLTDLIDEVLRRAAADLTEDEAIHDLRVACRRLEAGARVNGALLPKKRQRAIRDAAKAIRRAFDQARDREVIAAEIADVPELSPAFRAGMHAAAAGSTAPDDARASAEEHVQRLAEVRHRLDDTPALGRTSYAAAVTGDITAFFDELQRLLPESTDDALHEARISAKKLRYAMEIGRPAFPRLAAQVKRIKRLQDIIGRHQDAVVGLRWAEALAEGEYGATAADRATLMRYYATLRREQRRRLRRLLTGWRARDIKTRFMTALRQGGASGEGHTEDAVDDGKRRSDAGKHQVKDGALLVRRLDSLVAKPQTRD